MKKLPIILTMLLGGICAPVNADTYQFPVVTSVAYDSEWGLPGAKKIMMASVPVHTPSTWDMDTTLADVMEREGYPRHSTYNAGLVIETMTGCPRGCIGNYNLGPGYSGSMSFKQFINKINGEYAGTVSGLYPNATGRCYGFLVWSRTDTLVPTDQFLLGAWNGGVDSKKCISAPPQLEWCAFTSGRTDVDFGTLTSAAAAAAEKTVIAKVYCTSNMRYSITAPQGPSVMLSNGMSALIKIGGMKPGSYISGNKGENAVDISANLTGTPTKSGSFAGSTLLFVTYP